MSFKDYMKGSSNQSANLEKWQKAWKDFYDAANKLETAWENIHVEKGNFARTYPTVFKNSFDEVAHDISRLSRLAQMVSEKDL